MYLSTAFALLSYLVATSAATPLFAPASQLTKRVLDLDRLSPGFQSLTAQFQTQGTLVKAGLASLPSDSPSGEAVVGICGPYLTTIDEAINDARTSLSVHSSRFSKRQLGVDADAVAQDMADSLTGLANALQPLASVMDNDDTMAVALHDFLEPVNVDLAVLVGGIAAVVPGVLQQLNEILSTRSLADTTSTGPTFDTLGFTNLKLIGVGA